MRKLLIAGLALAGCGTEMEYVFVEPDEQDATVRVEYVYVDAYMGPDADPPDQHVNPPTEGACSDFAALWGPEPECEYDTVEDLDCPDGRVDNFVLDQGETVRACIDGGEIVAFISIDQGRVHAWQRLRGMSGDIAIEVQCTDGLIDWVVIDLACTCWRESCIEPPVPFCIAGDSEPRPPACNPDQ